MSLQFWFCSVLLTLLGDTRFGCIVDDFFSCERSSVALTASTNNNSVLIFLKRSIKVTEERHAVSLQIEMWHQLLQLKWLRGKAGGWVVSQLPSADRGPRAFVCGNKCPGFSVRVAPASSRRSQRLRCDDSPNYSNSSELLKCQ